MTSNDSGIIKIGTKLTIGASRTGKRCSNPTNEMVHSITVSQEFTQTYLPNGHLENMLLFAMVYNNVFSRYGYNDGYLYAK